MAATRLLIAHSKGEASEMPSEIRAGIGNPEKLTIPKNCEPALSQEVRRVIDSILPAPHSSSRWPRICGEQDRPRFPIQPRFAPGESVED
jgi:hypothetical protein